MSVLGHYLVVLPTRAFAGAALAFAVVGGTAIHSHRTRKNVTR